MPRIQNITINCTEVNCHKCYEMGIYELNEPVTPPHLIRFAVVHCYIVFILGTLCNGVAVYCVVTCTKTKPAVKVLLCSVFVPILVLCLVTKPALAEMLMAILTCDDTRTPKMFRVVTSLLYSGLAQMELLSIATISVVRAVAVWSSRRHTMTLRAALLLVLVITLYSTLMAVGLLGSLTLGYLEGHQVRRGTSVLYFFLKTMLPFLVTAVCYAFMMHALYRNHRRLSSIQHSSNVNRVVDQATRAMLAVFICNLLFGFPHSVFHLLDKPSHTSDILCHILFYTHFIVDPVVFVWFNRSYRHRIGEGVRAGVACVTQCFPRTKSVPCATPNTTSNNLASYIASMDQISSITSQTK
ncbi:hypothetical protein OTU49_003528 [Cherax quadricarinatus]|uniref:G-protein coupled receptors family 1 profile domain-containing protein n=1 Tax=Cherax quadricarinatus TaxID=27406 RepID=A0AAW0XI58_CHEQU|nr:C-C chemokine receptor type 9-like isoform X2 [Cherax quadricarinatus]